LTQVIALFGLFAGTARAADVDAANVFARGGTANAAWDDNAALTSNPGVLGLAVRYDFAGLFQYGPQGDLEWGASIADSRTTPRVAFGIAYVGGITTPPLATADLPGWKLGGEVLDPERRDHQVNVGLAVPLLDHRLSVGVGGEVLFFDREIGGSGTTGNLDLGLGGRPLPWLGLGLAARDLVPTTDGAVRPLTLAAGALAIEEFGSAAFDVDYTPEYGAVDWAAGLEGTVSYGTGRVGFRDSELTGARHFTWGIGFAGDGASLDYGMAVPVGERLPGDGLAHLISLSFAAPDLDRARPDDRM
jgi:hypothetical protein